ncbi:MAG: glutamate racemase [Chloroflexota bacterium]|nr:glutamate racemase [Chloroflexota bacterium]
MSSSAPIGVFDSGVGGLSVLRAIRAALPHEDLVYVADSAHVPYGSKSQHYIQQRSLTLTMFLTSSAIGLNAKAVVVACNTATAAAAALLRSRFGVPIVAMEPAVKPAVAATKVGVVGVLATVGTLQSAQFAALLGRFGAGVEVVTQPCPGLAEQVEAGDLWGPTTRALVEQYTKPLLTRGADTIVLGCTHYPFLRPLIQDIVGPDVALIDTGAAVAQQLRQVLAAKDLITTAETPGHERFWTTGDVHVARDVFAKLWAPEAEVQQLPDEFAGLHELEHVESS